MALSLLCMKILFISTGVLSVAFALKTSVPVVVDFSTTQAPAIWSGFCSWLKPPYLYIIINGIIISIAASSRFYNQNQSSLLDEELREREIVPDHDDNLQIPHHHQSYGYDEAIETVDKSIDDQRTDVIRFDCSESTVEEKREEVVYNSGSVVVENEIRTDFSAIQSPAAEKPLVSSRFSQRKPAKVNPEGGGRTLGVSKPKREETLENTWKMITEGRSMPLNRHLKKSDTFAENFNGRQREINAVEAYQNQQVKKSETFKDRTNYQSPVNVKTPLKLKKEVTLTNDELNRRVEAFIKKFNQEMRLQRQESLCQ